MARAVFFYDLGSPYAYLAAERVNGLFVEAVGEPPEWQPVLLGVTEAVNWVGVSSVRNRNRKGQLRSRSGRAGAAPLGARGDPLQGRSPIFHPFLCRSSRPLGRRAPLPLDNRPWSDVSARKGSVPIALPIALKQYAHVVPGMQAEAAIRIADLVGSD